MHYRLSLEKRISLRIGKARRTFHVDTKSTREHLINQLEEIFQIASDYARGKIEKVVDENEKERPLTIIERQLYARIAAYTAQTINSIAKGIDIRQIDEDLDKLEAMLHRTPPTSSVSQSGGEPPRKSEGT